MTASRLLLLVFLLTFTYSSAQMMNVRKWRKSERDSLDNALLLMDEKYFLQAVPIFENLLANHPREPFLKYSFARTALHRPDKHELAYQYLREIWQNSKKLPDIAFEMALAAHYNYKFDEALSYAELFLRRKRLSAEDREKTAQLKKNIHWARHYFHSPTNARITNLGLPVNSEWDEYVPAITADESAMIFTYAGEKSLGGRQNAYLQEDLNSGIFMEDIYMTVKKDDVFQPPVPIDSLNTNAPDAAISLSNDGRVLFVYKDVDDGGGDLYQSFLVGETFSRPQKLKGKVNSYAWDGHCSLSPDGQTLYFSSERSGGFGGRDLYRASLAADSSWTNIVNLGDSVNTALDEDAPYIHADGVSLYYSSKGRTSMGGYDIFRAMMDPADTSFRQVEHLGYPINSPADDIYFVLAANGRNGYYSSARSQGKGLKDLYLVETRFSRPAPALLLVKGRVLEGRRPVEARLEVSLASGARRVFGTFVSNAASGNYLLSLPAGASYELAFTYSNYPAQRFSVNTATITSYKELVRDVEFTPRDTTVALTRTVTPAPEVTADRDGFVPLTKLQAKSLRYMQLNGDIEKPGLVFKVQIGALRNSGRFYYPHLARVGRIEKLPGDDGLTRLMLGGNFKSLRKAFAMNKKAVRAGQQDAFVVAFYKGRRLQFEDLVKLGIFRME